MKVSAKATEKAKEYIKAEAENLLNFFDELK